MKVFRFLLIVALLAFAGSQAFASESGKRPNVVIVLTDDQGYGDMSCHGNPYLDTPHLDRLHEQSARLDNFHVDPTCSPSRAALMTGRYSLRTGVWLTFAGRNHLHREEVTIADVFSENGYRTGIFGKWHLGDNYPFRPSDRGFDESLVHGGGVVGETPDYWNNDYYDDVYFRNNLPVKTEGYCTDVWFNEAMDFISDCAREGTPFFVYLPTNAPHNPFHVPIRYAEPFLCEKGISDTRALFYGMIRSVDENLGKLRRRLEDIGQSRNTILIFMTDNGTSAGVTHGNEEVDTIDGFNAGMRGIKGSAYEGGHRGACFIHWPDGGLHQGKDVDALTAHIDLLPTLIDLCELESSSKPIFDGKSLRPLLQENSPNWQERTLFVHNQARFGEPTFDGRAYKYKDYAVMTERWRLVGDELFDVAKDPGQRMNVAANHPEVAARLKEGYENWWRSCIAEEEERAATVVNPKHQFEVVLTSQMMEGDWVPYNQHHVRTGLRVNGVWSIDVEIPGDYIFELRRWPRESGGKIRETLSLGPYRDDRHSTRIKWFSEPDARIDAVEACVKIGETVARAAVSQSDESIRMRIHLKNGQQKIESWFLDSEGEQWAPYYLYLRPEIQRGMQTDG